MKPNEKTPRIILAAAVKLANDVGLLQFSRADIASAAGVGQSTVSYYFGSMPEVRVAIVKHAVQHEMLKILADARSSRAPLGVMMPAKLKEKVAAYIKR